MKENISWLRKIFVNYIPVLAGSEATDDQVPAILRDGPEQVCGLPAAGDGPRPRAEQGGGGGQPEDGRLHQQQGERPRPGDWGAAARRHLQRGWAGLGLGDTIDRTNISIAVKHFVNLIHLNILKQHNNIDQMNKNMSLLCGSDTDKWSRNLE